jgi:tetratricopeptide (TPR) repeat protein
MRMTKVVLALVCAAAAFAQVKQPKPKNQKELDALMAVQNATDLKARVAAIDNVLTKFADTEFKNGLLIMGAATYQQMGDNENMIIWAERSLESDPKSYQAMLMLGNAYSTRTKEFDLDKEDKLKKAEDYATRALEQLKTAEKPRADLTDEQWTEAKKQLIAQAHEILGTSAMVRKKYEAAIAEFKIAVDAATPPDSATLVRLAAAYNQAGQPDQALPLLEKVMNTADAHPQVKSVAQAERVRAMQIKKQKEAPASDAAKPASPAPQPVATPTPTPTPTPNPAE